jgi:hypothetical protein
VGLNGEAGAKLLIRHQQSHGLAPILDADSLVWIEIGHMKTPGGSSPPLSRMGVHLTTGRNPEVVSASID